MKKIYEKFVKNLLLPEVIATLILVAMLLGSLTVVTLLGKLFLQVIGVI